jgi:TetR/AcrR family transcriptional regulator, transcriptional repressor for nem operon
MTSQEIPDGPKQKLLASALQVIRTKGYTATTVDDICLQAGVTKGSFFHHFKGKEALAIEATEYWTAVTGRLFATAPFRSLDDPRDRVLAYLDFRGSLIKGDLADFTCLLGTMIQETFETHPAIRDACNRGIQVHAGTVEQDLIEAKHVYAPQAAWDPYSVALFTQAAIQGAFILAKAQNNPAVAVQTITHLREYVAQLLAQESAPRPSVAKKRRINDPDRI